MLTSDLVFAQKIWQMGDFGLIVTVSSGEIRLGGQEHFYMETQSMLVVPVGEETEFNIYVSTQWPTLIQVRRYFLLTV